MGDGDQKLSDSRIVDFEIGLLESSWVYASYLYILNVKFSVCRIVTIHCVERSSCIGPGL